MAQESSNKRYVMLDNIRSAHNTGSIFRTAEAAGVSKIYLTGTTPTPIDRFGRERKDIAKAALGAEKLVEWEYHSTIFAVLEILKGSGVEIVGVEQHHGAIDYRAFKPTSRHIGFIFGNEVKGLEDVVLKQCDKIIEIPMHGKKESLNVSVAAGIILFS
jgi:23S rRNA (guanosine2251-2'-O)-methyltransferase